MHPDVAAVITELDAHRVRFEGFCRALSPEELSRTVPNSTWVVKDFVSHLATIDEPVESIFRNVHAGKGGAFTPEGGSPRHVDTWNDEAVAQRRGRSLDEIFAEAARRRAAIEEAMAELTQDDLDQVMTFGGDSKRPAGKFQLLRYLRGWNKHDPMHVVDMMRALPERKSAELDAWFDDPAIKGYQAAMNR
jgi:Mycothiol maleylpyruvate isomerase N-terminal domain